MKKTFSFVFSFLISKLHISKNQSIQKVIDLYKGNDFSGQFVKIRFWDSPYLEVEKMVIKKGRILELGCGEGIFSNYLAIRSPGRQILGIDLDRERLVEADRGLRNTKFKYGNATKVKLGKFDSIISFHLLHHLKSYKEQITVVKKCVQSLNKGGQLIIVEVDIKINIKYFASWLVDSFIVPWLFEKRLFNKIHFLKKNEWEQILGNEDLKFKTHILEKNKPFTHIVFEAYKQNN